MGALSDLFSKLKKVLKKIIDFIVNLIEVGMGGLVVAFYIYLAAKIPLYVFKDWMNNQYTSWSLFFSIFWVCTTFFIFLKYSGEFLDSKWAKDKIKKVAPRGELENINNFFFRLTVFMVLYVFLLGTFWYHDIYGSVYPIEFKYTTKEGLVISTTCHSLTGKMDYVTGDHVACDIHFNNVTKNYTLEQVTVVGNLLSNTGVYDTGPLNENIYEDYVSHIFPQYSIKLSPEPAGLQISTLVGEFDIKKHSVVHIVEFYYEPITMEEYRRRTNERFGVLGAILSVAFFSIVNTVKVLRDIIQKSAQNER